MYSHISVIMRQHTQYKDPEAEAAPIKMIHLTLSFIPEYIVTFHNVSLKSTYRLFKLLDTTFTLHFTNTLKCKKVARSCKHTQTGYSINNCNSNHYSRAPVIISEILQPDY